MGRLAQAMHPGRVFARRDGKPFDWGRPDRSRLVGGGRTPSRAAAAAMPQTDLAPARVWSLE
eukprot:2599180-Rhodomonas_salina.6